MALASSARANCTHGFYYVSENTRYGLGKVPDLRSNINFLNLKVTTAAHATCTCCMDAMGRRKKFIYRINNTCLARKVVVFISRKGKKWV